MGVRLPALLSLLLTAPLWLGAAEARANGGSSAAETEAVKAAPSDAERIAQLEARIAQLEAMMSQMGTQIKENVYNNVPKLVDEAMKTQAQQGFISLPETEKQALTQQIEQSVSKNIQHKTATMIDEKLAESFASLPPAAGPEQSVVTFGPGLTITSADGLYSFRPVGRIFTDYALFNDDVADHPDGASIRAARLGAMGKLGEDFNYKLELDFGNEDTNLRDAYIGYTGVSERTTVRVGNMKAPFSLENVSSNSDITFIERASPVTAFANNWLIGMDYLYSDERWNVSTALLNDDASEKGTDDEAWQADIRATGRPWLEGDKYAHIGGGLSYRVPSSQSDLARFQSKAENSIQNLQSVDTGAAGLTDADDVLGSNLEAALNLDNLLLQGEYFRADVSRNSAEDAEFSGFYAQASYLLTGETRPYNAARGLFTRVKPDQPFKPENGHWGAFELAARYSQTDLNDGALLGGEMDNYTLGLNWHLTDQLRLKSNYIFVNTDENAVTGNDDPQIFLMRAQVDF